MRREPKLSLRNKGMIGVLAELIQPSVPRTVYDNTPRNTCAMHASNQCQTPVSEYQSWLNQTHGHHPCTTLHLHAIYISLLLTMHLVSCQKTTVRHTKFNSIIFTIIKQLTTIRLHTTYVPELFFVFLLSKTSNLSCRVLLLMLLQSDTQLSV